ncbi:unnamed protein product [marine sediment metagenome]|uniref:Nicotinamide mononucleotide transporter PnuC n=1 Tax=marine sediment metagenome TaxID=412755 RepID=X1CEV8_9ZZZZ
MILDLDWFLLAVNVAYTYFMSRGKKIGLWILLGIQPGWALYGWQTGGHGIIALSVFYSIIAIMGIRKWKKEN